MIGRGAIQHQKRLDIARQIRLAQPSHAGQIAFAFFADIADQNRLRMALFEFGRAFNAASHGQQRGQSGTVVGNTWAVKFPVSANRDVLFGARREHGIEVGGKGDVGAA